METKNNELDTKSPHPTKNPQNPKTKTEPDQIHHQCVQKKEPFGFEFVLRLIVFSKIGEKMFTDLFLNYQDIF